MAERRAVGSGAVWEELAGYARAVRVGNQIWVAGTVASGEDGPVGIGDPAAQVHFIVDKIEAALVQLGGQLSDVVRTRMFVSDMSHWEAVARAHGARFGHIRPATTLVEARLIGPDYLVEIEAEAIIDPIRP